MLNLGPEAATTSWEPGYLVATLVFLGAFAAIVSEKVDKTKAALLGAAFMIGLPILSQQEAFYSHRFGIDYDVVFLLIGMMIIVNILSTTGIFEWTAIRLAKMGKGRPMMLMIIFIIFTAVASAFLDNVTTVLLLAPVTLLLADEMEIDPIPFLLAEVLASNIGGTATLIGDPPNIIIASKAKLTFGDFLVHLAPIIVVILALFVVGMKIIFGKRLTIDEAKRQRILRMDERRLIKDKALARKSVIVLAFTIAGFALHGVLHIEPATVALIGAAVLLFVSRKDPHHVLAQVEWPTIFFFIGLFIMVGGIVKVGLVRDISQFVITFTNPTETDMLKTSVILLWASGILSAIVDNIPYVATMSPLIQEMANTVFHGGALDVAALPKETLHHPVLEPVWWSLALGSCLGGNGTPVGASANVIVLGIAARSGTKVSFLKFMTYGVPTTIFTLIVSTIYIYLRYY